MDAEAKEELGDMKLHTIGYGGRSVGGLVVLLKEAGVKVLVDIRSSPKTRIPGFSKPSLTLSIPQTGIQYLHLQDLGAANHKWTGPEKMRHDLLNNEAAGLKSLVKVLEQYDNVAIMCAEKSYQGCHRQYVAQRMEETLPGLDVQHLGQSATHGGRSSSRTPGSKPGNGGASPQPRASLFEM